VSRARGGAFEWFHRMYVYRYVIQVICHTSITSPYVYRYVAFVVCYFLYIIINNKKSQDFVRAIYII